LNQIDIIFAFLFLCFSHIRKKSGETALQLFPIVLIDMWTFGTRKCFRKLVIANDDWQLVLALVIDARMQVKPELKAKLMPEGSF
jgi:hypothetical protein